MPTQKQIQVSAFTQLPPKRNQLTNHAILYANGKSISATALWDTGASISCISKKVIEQLQLIPAGYTKLKTPSGETNNSPLFLIDIELPNKVVIPCITVAGSEIGNQNVDVFTPGGQVLTESLDMLIGMDIIMHGDFCVSNFNNRTIFSFRIPSIAETDYVKHLNALSPHKNAPSPDRNEPCPCGSGKKYKNCCGKNK